MNRTAEPSNRVNRLLRELAARAHQEALGRELSKLQESFHAWQAGKLSAFDLNEEIHHFHDGPSRKLYVFYTSKLYELIIARAIIQGLLSESSLPEEVRIHLAPAIAREREALAQAQGSESAV
jgi:hypothetical protein